MVAARSADGGRQAEPGGFPAVLFPAILFSVVPRPVVLIAAMLCACGVIGAATTAAQAGPQSEWDGAAGAAALGQPTAPGEAVLALGAIAERGPGATVRLQAALPSPAAPETVIDAVTVDLPVWPWSRPIESEFDDPARGYNIWTYAFAVLLIAAGLALGRRSAPPQRPPSGRRERAQGAD